MLIIGFATFAEVAAVKDGCAALSAPADADINENAGSSDFSCSARLDNGAALLTTGGAT
jgi:hypothetical protein